MAKIVPLLKAIVCVKDFLALFSVFVSQKVTVNENVSFSDHASGTRLPDCSKLVMNWKIDNGVTICRREVIVIFFVCVCDVAVFLLSSLVTGSGLISISLLVLEF